MLEDYPQDAVPEAAHDAVDAAVTPLPVLERVGEWWATNWIIANKVKNPPTEIYKITVGDTDIDLLNFSSELLSVEELQQIADTLDATMTFTQGKILDRIIGIALLPEECYRDPQGNNEVQGRPNVAGDLNRMNPVVNINIDGTRCPIDDSFVPFIEKLIPGAGITMLQEVLAHELGHAMDLTYLEEIRRQGIDMSDAGFSPNGRTKSFTAFENPDPSVYLLEKSISNRARDSAGEDFAETFALAVLGADMSLVPHKMKRIHEVIGHAVGRKQSGTVTNIQK